MKYLKLLPKVLLFTSTSLFLAWVGIGLHAQTTTQKVGIILNIDGPIGPATSDYIHRGFEFAKENSAKLIILQMNTPGGLDTSMREIIGDILSSSIPVITYVAPNGARAASAGTYILYASHLAVMAPATNLGAATPVQIGTPMGPEEQKDGKTQKPGLQEKALSDAIAYIKGLADIQRRNEEWAVKFVAEAASLTAKEALKEGVIELVAKDLDDLLAQADGKTVVLLNQETTLETEDLDLITVEADWRTKLLEIITNPNIAYFLLIIGLYGIIFEFTNPGAILPGVIGTICLLVALYALHVLPINYAGLALILVGIAFIVAEAFMPSFGALGIGGVIAFVIGSIMLIETEVPGFELFLPLIIFMAAISGGFLFLTATMALRSHRKPVVSGRNYMINMKGRVLSWKNTDGMIKVQGETWKAHSMEKLKPGQDVIIKSIDGLILEIKPLNRETTDV